MVAPAHQTRRRRRALLMLLALPVLAGAGLVATRWRSDRLCDAAVNAFVAGEFEVARGRALDALWWNRSSARALIVAGNSSRAMGRFAEAVEHYDRLRRGGGSSLAVQVDAARLVLDHLSNPTDAERRFRQILAVDREQPAAVQGLADLLGLTSRRWEAIPLLLEVVRGENFRVEHLTLLGAEGGAHQSPELWRRWIEERPDDPLANLAMAWHWRNERQPARVEECLRTTLKTAPELAEAHAQLGELLVESGRFDELVNWHRALPPDADEFPLIWKTRGAWACQRGDETGAIRCYLESLALNPNLTDACYQLGQLLQRSAGADAAAPFFARCAALQQLKARESVLFHAEHTSLDPLKLVVEQMEALGRRWEAWGWSRYAQRLSPSTAWPRITMARLEPLLATFPPWNLPERNPALAVDIREYRLPDWTHWKSSPAGDAGPATLGTEAPISYRDDGPEVGLDFAYVNGGNPAAPGPYMYEFTGGGAGVVDFDADGWPDLYLTQGGAWPPAPEQQSHLDQLFRNQMGARFENVTALAGIRENSFSQGIAAGDVDGDGFVDLYVANIGRNRLLINQGDGTYHERWLPGDPGRWTTSCVMADFNGDGFPDLYAVNYLEAPDVFERICAHQDGAPRLCTPLEFPGSCDEFYLNDGVGAFREAFVDSGLVDRNGKGLGVVAADFDGSGRLSLFVANDMVENFYFANETSVRGSLPEFVECGVSAGLAYGADGRAHASMGVAVGDTNGDGLLDMLITNFLEEPDVLYVQKPGGIFADEASRAGIAAPTVLQLGFGTQFVDGDLDGWQDLVLTNGHIDDHRAYGRPYHMPPQFFRNRGDGRFRELPPADLGPFFAGAYLGRGMARLDWDRDGAEDVVICHLDSPTALLTNATIGRGDFLKLDLRGVQSERDAIGAVATLRTAFSTLVRQVTAGDGYQASNERNLIFGLGSDDSSLHLTVRWPSGTVDEIADVPRNRHFILIEGRNQLLTLPSPN